MSSPPRRRLAPTMPMRVPPPEVVVLIGQFMDDHVMFFSFLDGLGTADARGPLEPLWQLGLKGDWARSHKKLWPRLHAGGRDGYFPSDLYEPFAQFYRQVVVDEPHDVEWLERFVPEASLEWRNMPDEDSSQDLDEWYATWATSSSAHRITRVEMNGKDVPSQLMDALPMLPHLAGLAIDGGSIPSLDSLLAYVKTSRLTELRLVGVLDVSNDVNRICFEPAQVRILLDWVHTHPVRVLEVDDFKFESDDIHEYDDAARDALEADFCTTLFNSMTLESLRLHSGALFDLDLTAYTLPMRELVFNYCSFPLEVLPRIKAALEASNIARWQLRGSEWDSETKKTVDYAYDHGYESNDDDDGDY
ncbi:Aste57867_11482 [Aphanomyces stellatus]|uniref:Aste57867_11482 protein n=1 Tax=Aphanomyces stellatus TaxID=120398 RepID=A0A485KT41_9STRA|nr:hypothetical protein As57867_011439 [Aphanomyces stellatus]VFT88343.1 Aste57867_11482 [Aphanomyces stellatus]